MRNAWDCLRLPRGFGVGLTLGFFLWGSFGLAFDSDLMSWRSACFSVSVGVPFDSDSMR